MKVLVTAASKHGATAEIAEGIGQLLRSEGLEVTVVPPERAGGVEEFDAVILGSAVYAGHWMSEAKEFVDAHREALQARPVWLFSSGPVGDPPKPEEPPVDVAAIVEATNAREHAIFNGRIERSRLGFAEKAIVVALRVPDGDFRDWPRVRAWATEVAAALKRASG